jgi:hypothetical protein
MGKSKVGLLFRIIGKLFIWKVLGKGSPNPFFDKNGNPIVEPSLVHHKTNGSDSIES